MLKFYVVEEKLRKRCANEAKIMCENCYVIVLTSESLEICLCVVLELTPQELFEEK